MNGTTANAPPICSITPAGIVVPAFEDVLAWVQGQWTSVYGEDVVLDNSTPDGQMCGILAIAFNDINILCAAVFNSFSPSYAQGTQLSSLVKINGLAREVASNSTIDVAIAGQVGTVIPAGIINDGTYNWTLPSGVTVGPSGQTIVTATCATQGAIALPSGNVFTITTPTYGWQSATATDAASPGAPVETDAALRQRQAVSTAIPSTTIIAGIVGALLNLPGVTAVSFDNNTSNLTDANGVPAGNVAFVVTGGNALSVATTIFEKMTPGVPLFGTTQETVVDQFGVPNNVSFYRPTQVTISAAIVISIHGITGYTSLVGAEIIAAVMAYVNAQPAGGISGLLRIGRMAVPASLFGPYAVPANPGDPGTFEFVSIRIGRNGVGSVAAADVPLAFYEQPVMTAANVTLQVNT